MMDKHKVNVLVIEDDPDDYLMAEDLLADVEDSRYEFRWLKTYEEGLKNIGEDWHDVCLLDFRLNGRTGLELLEEVSSEIQAPVILLTGQNDKETDMEAMRAGAYDYLVKGQITTHMLERSIRYALSRKSTEKALKEKQEALIILNSELEAKNKEIWDNRIKLQDALDKVKHLINQVIDKKEFNVRFENPNLVSCSKTLGCEEKKCRCHGDKAVRCWQISGTYCRSECHGAFVDKYKHCSECPVFMACTDDPLYMIGEQFNNMMHILEQKNMELEEAYNELGSAQSTILQQEKMASIGQLAAGVAHEINNPIGFITSNLGTLMKYVCRCFEYIALLESEATNGNADAIYAKQKELKIAYIKEDAKDLIDESLDGADRVKRIVQDLKSFSRVDEAEYKHADINECLESTINIVWNELKYKATLNKDYGNIPHIKCYPQQINQVFMNLLVNAAQAIETQGEIFVKTSSENESVLIHISDTGSGIPADKVNRIFEPFFTTKEVGKGTGLGLSITYDIINKHNGSIQVQSKEGEGTTFTISLPIVEGR